MNLVIVEDQPIVREGIQDICRVGGHAVLASVGDGAQAVAAILSKRPDLAIVDLELPEVDGFSVIAAVRAAGYSTRFLLISALCDAFTVFRVEEMAVEGFVDKNTSSTAQLLDALKTIAGGRRYFSPSFEAAHAARRLDSQSFDKVLSDREREVLLLIGDFQSDSQIAQQLGISPKTVENHRASIQKKLNVDTRANLVRLAIAHGFRSSVVKRKDNPPGSGLGRANGG